ncbi:hypothetical protein Pmar_PMAR021233, partial [Perkinsus marinus ATCC 50983]
MAQLYAFKCDELALERAKRIEHMEELAKMKAEREKEKESLQEAILSVERQAQVVQA